MSLGQIKLNFESFLGWPLFSRGPISVNIAFIGENIGFIKRHPKVNGGTVLGKKLNNFFSILGKIIGKGIGEGPAPFCNPEWESKMMQSEKRLKAVLAHAFDHFKIVVEGVFPKFPLFGFDTFPGQRNSESVGA